MMRSRGKCHVPCALTLRRRELSLELSSQVDIYRGKADYSTQRKHGHMLGPIKAADHFFSIFLLFNLVIISLQSRFTPTTGRSVSSLLTDTYRPSSTSINNRECPRNARPQPPCRPARLPNVPPHAFVNP